MLKRLIWVAAALAIAFLILTGCATDRRLAPSAEMAVSTVTAQNVDSKLLEEFQQQYRKVLEEEARTYNARLDGC